MAELRATPMSNPVMGLLADRLKKVQQFGAKPFGYENPPVEMLMNLLGVPAVQQTMERMAYGEPLTTGRGMTTKPRPEALEAAMTLLPASVGAAKATKGLPVGASVKPINIEKGIYKPDLTMEEMLKVRDIPTVERVQKSVELVGEKQFEKMIDAQFKKYKPSSPEQEAMLVESVTLQILGKAERSPFPRQEALDTAQRNAALPIEEGGLGLPKDNTPMDRAKAMGFDKDVYHGTSSDISEVVVLPEGRRYIRPFYTTADTSEDAAEFASQFANTKSEMGNPRVMPLLMRGDVMDIRNNPEAAKKLADIAEQSYTELRIGEKGLPTWGQVNNYATEAKNAGIDAILLDERPNLNSIANLNPKNIRSRFAAFDPMRRNETDILAGVLPLGLLADEEQRKKLYELMPSLLGE